MMRGPPRVWRPPPCMGLAPFRRPLRSCHGPLFDRQQQVRLRDRFQQRAPFPGRFLSTRHAIHEPFRRFGQGLQGCRHSILRRCARRRSRTRQRPSPWPDIGLRGHRVILFQLWPSRSDHGFSRPLCHAATSCNAILYSILVSNCIGDPSLTPIQAEPLAAPDTDTSGIQ